MIHSPMNTYPGDISSLYRTFRDTLASEFFCTQGAKSEWLVWLQNKNF